MEKIQDSYKRYRRGTHRSSSPADTLEKIKKFLPVFGITRVANITGLDNIGIPVVVVSRPNSRSLSVSQGKGISLISAKVSGVMESIESFHAERIFVPGVFVSYEDLFGVRNIIDLNKVPRIKSRVLDEKTKILWHNGIDLMNENEDVLVPHELISTDYTLPSSIRSGCFISDSNGLASGNTLLEAIVHGLCEVIERDALALWWATDNRRKCIRKIDASTISDPRCQKMIQDIDGAGILSAIWDITTDINIPTYVCKIMSDPGRGLVNVRPVYGSGCHPDKSIALSRAITEAAQSRLTFISGARDDQFKSIYSEYLSDKTIKEWHEDSFLPVGKTDFSARNSAVFDTIHEDYAHIMGQLKRIGIKQVVYVNLTRDEFGIPVVKMVIPGLEGITDYENRVHGHRMIAHLQGGNNA